MPIILRPPVVDDTDQEAQMAEAADGLPPLPGALCLFLD